MKGMAFHARRSAQAHATHQIVIVGGGAGGLELATKLGDKLGKHGKAHITLIDKARTHEAIFQWDFFNTIQRKQSLSLARKQGKAAQWIWRKILPRLAAFLPGTSTTMKSSAILTDLLTGSLLGSYSGAYFNYTGKQIEPAALATERWVADDLLSGSDALLAPFV
jgi:phosphoribosylpyrophosphate synthetase